MSIRSLIDEDRRRAASLPSRVIIAMSICYCVATGLVVAQDSQPSETRSFESLLEEAGSSREKVRESATLGLLEWYSKTPDLVLSRLVDAKLDVRRSMARVLVLAGKVVEDRRLIAAFEVETDRDVLRLFARVLSFGESKVMAQLRERGPAIDRARLETYLHQRVEHSLSGIIAENTDPDGTFKGFYDEQFERLADIGPDGDRFIAAIAADVSRSLVARRAAVRALGATARKENLERLEAVAAAHRLRFGYTDPKEGMRFRADPKKIDEYWDDALIEYIDYAMARCGDDGRVLGRMNWFVDDRDRWKSLLPYVKEDERAAVRFRIAEAIFRVAYCNQQLRRIDAAQSQMALLTTDFVDTGYAPIAWYNLACMQSRAGRVEDGLRSLDAAIKAGYLDAAWIRKDGDLVALRKDPRFAELMQRHGFAPSP